MPKFRDLSGMKFGRLTVVSFAGMNKRGSSEWNCTCDCGNTKKILGGSLVTGNTLSCGCYNKQRITETMFKDISGLKFGRLTALEPTGEKRLGGYMWRCRCDCGKEVDVKISAMTNGTTVSCGCYHHDILINRLTTHGLSDIPEYDRRDGIRKREVDHGVESVWSLEMEIELSRFFTKCAVCGKEGLLDSDHVYPLYIGRRLEPGNAVKLCRSCNSTKNRRTPEQMPDQFRENILKAANDFAEYWEYIHSGNLGLTIREYV